MCGAKCKSLVVDFPIILFFRLLSNVSSTALHVRLNLSLLLVLGVSHYVCSQLLDLIWIHLFRCVHGGGRMTLHDVV